MISVAGGIRNFLSGEKGRKIIIAAGVAVILLLFLSTLSFSKDSPQESVQESASQTERELEDRLTELISKIDGAGTVSVMVTLESTSRSVYAQQTRTESSSSGNDSGEKTSSETEVILAGSGKQPVEESVIQPTVRGVAVVCSGAADPVIKERITMAVSGVLNIGISQVYVTC